MSAQEIISNLSSSFDNALASGDLFFFPSVIHKHLDLGVEFEIRLCPALQKKPGLDFDSVPAADASLAARGDKSKALDPFAPPYNPNLYVGELRDEDEEEEYVVLLNKYSVVSQHFLLVSKKFKLQSSPLLPPDLVQTYLLLVAARKAGRHFLAFYNCGDSSGASQPHKHVQFFPLKDQDGPPIERLARGVVLETPDKPFSLTQLSYANHVFRFPSHLPSSTSPQLAQTLSKAFLFLLDLVVSTIRHDASYPAGKPSYNVLVTLEHMHLIPRRQETHVLGETAEKLSVNALGFAGMLLVKNEQELDAVRSEGVGKILRGVGLESVHDLQVAGTSLDLADGEADP